MSNDFYKNTILPYEGIIIKICRTYTDNEDDFKDFYQEVCLQIWKSKSNFKGNSAWSTWVYRICLNVCLTLLKKKDIKKQRLDSNSASIPESLENLDDKNEEVKRLYRAIKKLSEIDRAFILLYLEEKSYKEIAQIMGTTVTNVGAKISRIKKRLEKLYYES